MSQKDLDEFRREAFDPERTASLRESERRIREWERAHPRTLDSILDWIDQLRDVFGEFPVDTRPWKGDDFRL